MPEFLSLAVSGVPVVVPIPDVPETIYATGGRVRWTMTGTATETVNTVAGTHDGLTTSYDSAQASAGAGLEYSVGYAVQTPTVTDIESVTLRFRYRVTAVGGADIAFCELQAVWDNNQVAESLVTPAQFDWTWFEYEMPRDPDTADPWANAAAVSSKLWGFHFSSGVPDGTTVFLCAEIELLVTPA